VTFLSSLDQFFQPRQEDRIPGDRTYWLIPTSTVSLPPVASRPTRERAGRMDSGDEILSRVFRGKFVAGLKRRFQQHQLTFAGSIQPLAHQKAFHSFLRPLFRQDWVVYAKPPFGGPHHVLAKLFMIRGSQRIMKMCPTRNQRLTAIFEGAISPVTPIASPSPTTASWLSSMIRLVSAGKIMPTEIRRKS
jgi:hypothetical protein